MYYRQRTSKKRQRNLECVHRLKPMSDTGNLLQQVGFSRALACFLCQTQNLFCGLS